MAEEATPTDQAYKGAGFDPLSANSEFNMLNTLMQSALGKVRTAQAVKVVACTNEGGLAPAGTVDVLPLVNQLDGYGQPTEHKTIFARPYLRWQGGAHAIIMDPVPGDIGLLVCCDRDTSTAINTLAQANPGSARQFDFADGFYVAALGTGTPVNFIQFENGNINITSASKITVTAPEVDVISDNVNLGGMGGQKVALVGDAVSGGGTITGPGATNVRAV